MYHPWQRVAVPFDGCCSESAFVPLLFSFFFSILLWPHPVCGHPNTTVPLDADAQNLGKCEHPGGCEPTRWDSFGRMFEPLGAVVPTMTTPGNHEIELANEFDLAAAGTAGCDVTTVPFLEYRHRWFHYTTDSPDALHYSWDFGNVHNVMLNS
jgi:hypothetical protein